MTRNKTYLALAAALTLAGCGGAGEQDAGDAGQSSASGVAVDGYLARSVVWVDSDGDAQLDSFEPRAFTDDQGFYSYNPVTDTDYCAAGATAAQAQYCLEGRFPDGAVIRMVGGYDTTTGEPFDGMLSVATAGASLSGLVASPLTALLSSAGSDSRAELLSRLTRPLAGGAQLDESLAGSDFLSTRDGGTIDATDQDLIRLALMAHKPVAAIADLLEARYTRIGDSTDLPVSASAVVYDALVAELLATSSGFIAFMVDADALGAVIDNAEQRLRERYGAAGLDLPSALGDVAKANRATAAARLAGTVDSVVTNVMSNAGAGGDAEQRVRGGARAVEVVLRKIMNGSADFADAADWAENQPADVANLGGTGKDINALVDGDMDPNNANHSADADIPAEALPLTGFVGARLAMRYSGDGDSGAVLMYFVGEPTDTSGELRACVRYSGTSDDLDTDGLLLSGDWTLPYADNPYVMLVSAEIIGSRKAMMVRSADVNADNQAVFRFDYDQAVETWTGAPSAEAFDPVAIPSDDESCRQALVSEFGP